MKITKKNLYFIVEVEHINPILLLPVSQGSFFPDQLIYMVCVTTVVMMQSLSSYLIFNPPSLCAIYINTVSTLKCLLKVDGARLFCVLWSWIM